MSKIRLAAFFHSVRFRLALWFSLVLAVVLVVFGAFIYLREKQAIADQAVARLTGRMRMIQDMVYYKIRPTVGDDAQGDLITSLQVPLDVQDQEAIIQSDADGKVLTSAGVISATDAEQIAQDFNLLSGQPGSQRFLSFSLVPTGEKDERPADYLFAALPVTVNNRLASRIIVGRPVDPDRQVSRLLLTLILGGLLTLLVAIAGGYWLAGQALWPVHAITRTAREISESDLSKRLNLRTRDELGELAGTFDRMLDRLEAAFKRQRQFTSDASHELRTPLSIIALETGRALSARRPAEEYRRTLEVVQSENKFMTRLVEELLMLARMDSGQMRLKRESLDLCEAAADVLERFLPLAIRRGVELQAGELPELPVEGDRTLLGQMIANLVDNAIKYSPNGDAGPHWARVEAGKGEQNGQATAWLRVSDNGPGIPPEHLPHLFDRFYRVDTARSHNLGEGSEEEVTGSGLGGEDLDQDIPGSGLGLSIVQWIAEMHGGKVDVRSTPGAGTTFEISLPLRGA